MSTDLYLNDSHSTVLVVDDSDLSRVVISRLLRKQGYHVLSANDGAEGAVIALRELPDVVVTDLEMPVMDGYQLARLLKSDPSSSHIRLLILTSHDDASSRFWGLETGADAYLVKDNLETDLVNAVESLVQESRAPSATLSEVPKTSLDVLARVSRHLDERLLEAVLVNRILERGMKAESLREATRAVLDTVSDIVDTWMLGLIVTEPDSVSVFLRCAPEVERDSGHRLVEKLLHQRQLALEPQELVIEGGRQQGRLINEEEISRLTLRLRDAKALLLLEPRVPDWGDSREHLLIAAVRKQLSLVLDNARLAERLRELSMRDGLTRLFNRRTVHNRLCDEIERARRYDHPLSVALCDLDHFKDINDTHGHQAGDMVLKGLADVLRQQARAPDVAGRYGGEEFLIVLPETNLADASRAAQRLRQTIENLELKQPNGERLPITGSLGVSSLSEIDPGEDEASLPDRLLALADKRLYEAKAAGRNRVVP